MQIKGEKNIKNENEQLLNKILYGDCLEWLSQIEDNSISLVLTDPPYGINYYSNWSQDSSYREKVKSVNGISNDKKDNKEFLLKVLSSIYRVLKDNSHIYWFTRWDKVEEQKPLLEEVGFKVKNNLIWVKNNWSMGDLQGAYAGQYECILFGHKGRRTLKGIDGKKRHTDVIFYDRIPPNRLYHSHQKPTDLLEFLIEKSTDEGETIIDPFCGSGSTLVSAVNTNRNFIGIEIDWDYCQIANKRIMKAQETKLS